MNDPKAKKKPGKVPAASGVAGPQKTPRNDRPTEGAADGGSGTPDEHTVASPVDKGLRGLDKSGGSRGGGR
jgi:hypothetical protein